MPTIQTPIERGLRDSVRAIIFRSMSKDTEAATMEAEATKGKPEPAFRKPNQTRAGRLRKELIDDFVAKLGGSDRVTTIQLRDVERAADLEMLSATARAAALRGEESLGNVTRLEIQAAKAVRRLNLPAPKAAAAPVQTLADLIASHQHAEGDG
jgi:hypothetical protein